MIWAYTRELSYLAGQRVSVMASTDRETFSIEVAREGSAPEVVWRMENCPGRYQPFPADAASHGCRWSESVSIPTAEDWPSAVYSLTLRSESDDPARALFVLRPTRPASPVLLVLATNTYQAYNDCGGPCLYDGAVRVSFDRPFAAGLLHKPDPSARIANLSDTVDRDCLHFRRWAQDHGLSSWSGAAGWHNWERPFVRWAEKSGFRFDVATNADLEFHPEILDGHRLVVSVGHDEYWSWGMRDALEDFIVRGGNAAFFSGNDVCWQIRYEDGGDAFVAYKYRYSEDPVYGTSEDRFLTSLWSDRRVGRPENRLTGVSSTRGGYVRMGLGVSHGSGGYTVWRPDHWALEGTGLRYGDLFGAEDFVVAYEADGCELALEDGLPVPTGSDGTPVGFEILATSPAHLWSSEELPARYLGEPGDLEMAAECIFGEATPETTGRLSSGNAVMGTYTNGGTVFTTGCTDWSYGLHRPDPVVERITANVLTRLSGPARELEFDSASDEASHSAAYSRP